MPDKFIYFNYEFDVAYPAFLVGKNDNVCPQMYKLQQGIKMMTSKPTQYVLYISLP